MNPIVFPKWPERVMFALAALMVIGIVAYVAISIASFGALSLDLVARSAFWGLAIAAIGFLARRHRQKTEQRSQEYEKALNGLSFDG